MKSKIGHIAIRIFFTFVISFFLRNAFLSLCPKRLSCEISELLLFGLGVMTFLKQYATISVYCFRLYAHSSVMKVDLLTAPVFPLTLELLILGQAFPVGERQHRRVQEVCAAWHPGAGCLLQGSYCPGN